MGCTTWPQYVVASKANWQIDEALRNDIGEVVMPEPRKMACDVVKTAVVTYTECVVLEQCEKVTLGADPRQHVADAAMKVRANGIRDKDALRFAVYNVACGFVVAANM